MDKLLAIDQSCSIGSISLLDGATVLGSRSWEEKAFHNQRLFPEVVSLLAGASLEPAAIDIFAVGLGPGSFAGLRMSLSAALAWAMPGGKQVHGINSGEIMAADVFGQTSAGIVTVVGDARRDRIWYAHFKKDAAGMPVALGPYALALVSELPSVIRPDSVIVTSHWERIGHLLMIAAKPSVEVLQRPYTPSAATLGKLVLSKLQQGLKTDPLSPIYMHPPVFIEPKFPEATTPAATPA